MFTFVGEPDPGYVMTSANITYVDSDGKSQTISRNEEQIKQDKTISLPFHPRTVTATYYGVLRPADMTKAISKDNPYLLIPYRTW